MEHVLLGSGELTHHKTLLQAWQLFTDRSDKSSKQQQQGNISAPITEYYSQKRMEAERERLQQLLEGLEKPYRTIRWHTRTQVQGGGNKKNKIKNTCWHIRMGYKSSRRKMPPNSSAGIKGCRNCSPNARRWWVQPTGISSSWTRSLCWSHQQLTGISEKRRGQCFGCGKN